MEYQRPLFSTLLAELSRPTPVIHAIIGPRQVGKTTIAKQLEKTIGIRSLYATADSPPKMSATHLASIASMSAR